MLFWLKHIWVSSFGVIDSVYNSIMNISNQFFFFFQIPRNLSSGIRQLIWFLRIMLRYVWEKKVLPQIRKVNCFICRMRSLQDSEFFFMLCYIFPQNTILRMIVNLKRIMLLLNSDFCQKNSVNFFATHLCNHHIYTYCVNIQM